MQWTTLVCLIAVAEFLVFGSRVGAARVRLGVPAPATTGNPEFERYFRVQMNTLEQLVIFLPAAVAFAWLISDVWAAAIGMVWVVGRIVYFLGYVREAAKRGTGMLITFAASAVLLVGALYGSVRALL